MKQPTDAAIATYLRHVGLGVPMKRIARERGVWDWAVRKQVRRVEEAREDPAFDERVEGLVRSLQGRAAA